jgi:hypothetical protein
LKTYPVTKLGWSAADVGECRTTSFALPEVEASDTKTMRMTFPEHVARMGEIRNAGNIFVEKCEGKAPPKRRRKDIIIVDQKKVVCG